MTRKEFTSIYNSIINNLYKKDRNDKKLLLELWSINLNKYVDEHLLPKSARRWKIKFRRSEPLVPRIEKVIIEYKRVKKFNSIELLLKYIPQIESLDINKNIHIPIEEVSFSNWFKLFKELKKNVNKNILFTKQVVYDKENNFLGWNIIRRR